jgi:5-methylcytosine-specific restriction endonuclease McrA
MARSSVAVPDLARTPRREVRPQPRGVHNAPRVPGVHTHVTAPSTRAPRPAAPATPHPRPIPHLEWPASFDDWMIDIVRRRALRLNSGARRRGVRGSVRAVELGHILAQSVDAQGNWICALCHGPVTLNDLSFDHVQALADGGEHAAHNLVPAHRKCNEIKGSEKAQHRAHAVERWLEEWASSHRGSTPRAAVRHHAHVEQPAPLTVG